LNTVEGLKYTKNHEWVRVENNIATIGVTDFAQSQLGDVVFVELPEEGQSIHAGDSFSVIESVKAVSDVYAPVSGSIAKVNQELADQPDLVNQQPYDAGWIVTVELTDSHELDELMEAKEYERFVSEGGH